MEHVSNTLLTAPGKSPMEKKLFPFWVFWAQGSMLYCVFVRVSHSNQEESTSLQKKGLKSPWLASIHGTDASSALETVQVLDQQHLSA